MELARLAKDLTRGVLADELPAQPGDNLDGIRVVGESGIPIAQRLGGPPKPVVYPPDVRRPSLQRSLSRSKVRACGRRGVLLDQQPGELEQTFAGRRAVPQLEEVLMRRMEYNRGLVTSSESAQSLGPYRSQLCQLKLIAQHFLARDKLVDERQGLGWSILGAEHHRLIARCDQHMNLIIKRRKDLLRPTIGLAGQLKEPGHMRDGPKVEVAVRRAVKAAQRDELAVRRDEPGD